MSILSDATTIVNKYRTDQKGVHGDKQIPLIIKLKDDLKALDLTIAEWFILSRNRKLYSSDLKDQTNVTVEGSCNNCGKCCLLVGKNGCEHYDKNKGCLLGNNRPKECKDYPTKEDMLNGVVPVDCVFTIHKNGVLQNPKNTEFTSA